MVARRNKIVLEISKYAKRIFHSFNLIFLVHYSVRMPFLDTKYSLAANKNMFRFASVVGRIQIDQVITIL